MTPEPDSCLYCGSIQPLWYGICDNAAGCMERRDYRDLLLSTLRADNDLANDPTALADNREDA